MEKIDIIKSITERTGGDIYLGVVGAVRTGKSTFIKKVIETLVVPNIEDEYEKKRCLDEIPQSAQGKAIMTTEPKFVPSNGATIKIDEFTANIRLIDCVGYIVDNATGYLDENGKERSAISKFRLCFSGNFYLCPERTEYEDSLCGGSACCDCGCDFEDFSD